MKRLCILGSTGSVGQNCLRVVQSLPGSFQVVALVAGKNLEVLARQIVEFSPQLASVESSRLVGPLRERLQAEGYIRPLSIVAGTEGTIEAATLPEVDFVVSAAHGITGLPATYAAICAGKQVGLANKEVLVVAGELVTKEARQRGVEILPIDSEHSAVHQCIRSGQPHEVRRLILTGSGGPFLKTPQKHFDSITPEQALRHPVWKMGGRITIDSATLMNKGLEVIEAHWLFGLLSSQMEVVIHPECVIHSMLEFQDGSMMAQLSVADMRIPIQYALTYPKRVPVNGNVSMLDLASLRRLRFQKPDVRRFPCLRLGRAALEKGGVMPCALNGADEVAVEAFLDHRLRFSDIPRVIEEVMERMPTLHPDSLEGILECDREARLLARDLMAKKISGRSSV